MSSFLVAVLFVTIYAGPHNGDIISCDTSSPECHIQCNDSNSCTDAAIVSAAVSTTISCDSDDACSFSVMHCGNTTASEAYSGSCLIDIESSTLNSEIHCNGLNTCVVDSDHEWVSSTLHCYDNRECILLCPTQTSCVDSALMCHSERAHCECSGVGCAAVSQFILTSDSRYIVDDENGLSSSSNSTDDNSYFGVRFQYIVLLNVLAMIGFLLCCCGYLSIKVSRYFVLFYSDKLDTEDQVLQMHAQHSPQQMPASKSYSKSGNAEALSHSVKTPSCHDHENTVLLAFTENDDTDHDQEQHALKPSPPHHHHHPHPQRDRDHVSVHKIETWLIKTSGMNTSDDGADEGEHGHEHHEAPELESCTHTKFALPAQMKIDVNAQKITRDTHANATAKLDRLSLPNPGDPLALSQSTDTSDLSKSSASTEPEIDIVCHSEDSTMEPLSMTQRSLTLGQDNSRDTIIIRRSPQLTGNGHFPFERDRTCKLNDGRSEHRSYATVKMTPNTRSRDTCPEAQVPVLPLIRAHLSNSDVSHTHEHLHALALAANDSCHIRPIPEGTQCMIDHNPLQKHLFLTPGTNTAPVTPRSASHDSAQTYTMLFGSCASNEVSRNQDAEHDQASRVHVQTAPNMNGHHEHEHDDDIGDQDTLSLGMNTPTATTLDMVTL